MKAVLVSFTTLGRGGAFRPVRLISMLVALACVLLVLSPSAVVAGEVIAWGADMSGECTVPAEAQSGVIAIAAGQGFSLALTDAGKVIAWGYNFQGQCTVPAEARSGVVAIAAGDKHSLALTDAGKVIAWGWNFYGQCTVPAEAQSGIVAIDARYWHSLALTDDGEVIAWGENGFGQCTVPEEAKSGVVAIAAGQSHNLALTDAGKVIAWGRNNSGQCNVPLQAQSGVVAIAAGLGHNLTLTDAGQLVVWGSNFYGQCTVPAEAQSGIIATGGGYLHSLALTEAGEVIAWGWNGSGQCNVPLAAQSGVIAIAGGAEHSLAVLSQPPEADFSASPTSGTVPLTVQFTDLSTNSPSAWQWDFGDGGTSDEQNPSYTYVLAGIYTPSMTASNVSGSDTQTKARYIVVNFVDVLADNWAYDEIMACVDASIAAGYPDGSYHPEGPVNRAEMAAYVSRALAGGENSVPDPTTDPGFTDADETHWAYRYICYAADQGVVQGYPAGDYQPAAIVTRDQMAVYMARALVAPAGESALADYTPADARNFPDVLDTGYGEDRTEAHWAYRYVEYCVENGVVQGYEDGLYRPDQNVTRDQVAVFMARAFGLLQ
jgi:PKD repeat protein